MHYQIKKTYFTADISDAEHEELEASCLHPAGDRRWCLEYSDEGDPLSEELVSYLKRADTSVQLEVFLTDKHGSEVDRYIFGRGVFEEID